MYSKSGFVLQWLRYYLSAASGKGHGIHSPFVYDFVVNVLNDQKSFPEYDAIEKLRHELLLDKTLLEIDDFGAGSSSKAGRKRSVSDIARHAAKPARWGQLLFRMARYYRPHRLLELGSSLGISSAYLASGSPDGRLNTLEGSSSVASLAKQNFQKLGLKNIELTRGHFDNTLAKAIVSIPSNNEQRLDMVFVDGNHRKEPTLRYFEMLLPVMTDSSMIVFDDIHWSAEMEDAWRQIYKDQRVMLSVDLFFIGIVFIRKDFKIKQHFIIRH
jgi:predicted O-methyltransferase YrrM